MKVRLNYTRYNSADLEALWNRTVETAANSSIKHMPYQQGCLRGLAEELDARVMPLYSKGSELVSVGRGMNGDRLLYLASPKEMWQAFPLQSLALSEEMWLPNEAVGEIAKAFLCTEIEQYIVEDYWKEEERFRELSEMPIRILDKPPDKKPAGPKRSNDEVLRELYAKYGPGGEVRGSDQERTGSYGAPSGRAFKDQWRVRIRWAKDYYEREYLWLQKVKARIEKKGGSVQPYETFPDYLRRVANEIEEGQGWGP